MGHGVFGEVSVAVDANRVRVPAQYREYLGDKFVATPGSDGCFFLMPYEVKDERFKEYSVLQNPLKATAQQKMVVRQFNWLSKGIELDPQGRFVIDEKLTKTCTALNRPFDTLIFCGMGDYVEVWTQHAYNKVFGDKITSDDFDALLAGLQDQLNG